MPSNIAPPHPRAIAAYACDPRRSAGRLLPEPPSPTRTEYQRDRDRIIHSTAFRRLKYKTQVFVYHEGDHYRTRLTHSIEVSQIARSLARSLMVDEDLAEALALAHDLGHPPFGHAGERGLARAMPAADGFDHNAQSLAVVTRLENRYAAFDGLNLTWESLEGLVKHNGPLADRAGRPLCDNGLPGEIRDFSAQLDLRLVTYPGLEAQCAAIADDIAYNSHDIDDGLRAGLFTMDDLARAVPLMASMVDEVRSKYPRVAEGRLQHEVVRRLITALVEDVLRESLARIDALSPESAEDIRTAGRPMMAFSAAMTEDVSALRRFLYEGMYRHERVMHVMRLAEEVVERLFAAFLEDPGRMPSEWRPDRRTDARRVVDYIAGMTDRYALSEYGRLFDDAPELR